jgi:selenoprotein W-related protein
VAAIQEARGVEAELVRGANGVFDVVVDGRLIYSKHKTGRFPDPEEILAELG